MDMHELLLALSTPEKDDFVRKTGRLLGRTTSLGYFRKLAGGRAMPSIKMAEALIKASAMMRPGTPLDMDSFSRLRKERERIDAARKNAAARKKTKRQPRRSARA